MVCCITVQARGRGVLLDLLGRVDRGVWKYRVVQAV